MQLNVARLCLDCEEVHDAQECPVCASEVFAYLTRWVPSQARPPAPAPPRPSAPPPSRLRMLVPGMLGVGALGLAGWLWRSRGSSVAREDRKEERNQ